MNRIKSTLVRLGIRTFKPTLRKAAERLATVHTPEGMPLPPNTLAELQRDMARLGFVVSQMGLELHRQIGPPITCVGSGREQQRQRLSPEPPP